MAEMKPVVLGKTEIEYQQISLNKHNKNPEKQSVGDGQILIV